jgi:hypothetical protein
VLILVLFLEAAISMRTLAIFSALIAATTTPSVSQNDLRTRIGGVRVDCAAFIKDAAGMWETIKETVVSAGAGQAAARVNFPAKSSIRRGVLFSGIDLVDVLDQKCVSGDKI